MKKAVQPQTDKLVRENNRLLVDNKPSLKDDLLVELMQTLQSTESKAKENPKDAELNASTMPDNNGGRIIYNYNLKLMRELPH